MSSERHDELKKNTFDSLIWKFAERVCAQMVSLVVSIVLARMLMPEDYSVVSIVAIFFAFCNVFISGGMNASLIQKKDATIEDYSTVLYLNLALAAVLYGLMSFCAPLIAKIYAKPVLVSAPILPAVCSSNGFSCLPLSERQFLQWSALRWPAGEWVPGRWWRRK